MNVLPILAPYLIRFRCTARVSGVHYDFDVDGGTNSEGVLTLSDASDNTINFDGKTLASLVDAINALDNWEAEPHYGLPHDLDIEGSTGGLAAARVITDRTGRELSYPSDVATVTDWEELVFTNDHEVVANGVTEVKTAVAIPTQHSEYIGAQVSVKGTSSPASDGEIVYMFQGNVYYGGPSASSLARDWGTYNDADYWDTLGMSDDTKISNASGTSAWDRKSFQLLGSAVRSIRMGKVNNGAGESVHVYGHYLTGPRKW